MEERTKMKVGRKPRKGTESGVSQEGLSTEQIARHAYQIWEAEGRPHGRDIQHWLRAEAELRG